MCLVEYWLLGVQSDKLNFLLFLPSLKSTKVIKNVYVLKKKDGVVMPYWNKLKITFSIESTLA